MIKRLTRHGNSLALVIDKGVLDLLEIGEETPLSITTDGKCLVIAPVQDASLEKRFRGVLEQGNRRYRKMLKRLAD